MRRTYLNEETLTVASINMELVKDSFHNYSITIKWVVKIDVSLDKLMPGIWHKAKVNIVDSEFLI